MADPSTYRPAPGEIPTKPGVYRFLDESGRVIYVGKAKNLRARLSNYFQDVAALHPRTQKMVTTACAVEWTVVANEVESLALEYSWIKEFNPRFNVMYKDDKSYPYVSVSMGDTYPRVSIVRGARNKKSRYFGPYVQAWSIRDTVDQLIRVFPVRTCSTGVFRRAHAQDRPCLLGYIDKCSAPCVGRISVEDHRALAEDFCDFMAGKTGPYVRSLKAQMKEAAAEMDYEHAARLRDDVAALEKIIERNAIVLPDATDADVFALVRDEIEAGVQVFHVRGGRVRGQRGWVTDVIDQASDADLVARLLEQIYGDAVASSLAISSPDDMPTQSPDDMPTQSPDDMPTQSSTPLRSGPTSSVGVGERAPSAPAPRTQTVPDGQSAPTSVDDVAHTPTTAIPREILVPVLPTGVEVLTEWLSQARGAKVSIRVPQRGDKAALAQTVKDNAEEALRLHKTRRAGDLTQRSLALEELAEALDLPQAPLRIECYDVSHTQGTHQVASMVVFDDGAPRKSDYRRFTIRGEHGDGASDDTAAMNEVLTRRFNRLIAEETGQGPDVDDDGVPIVSGPIDPTTGRPKRFSYAPSLVVVDGGLPQVNAARKALDDLGIDTPLIGLAKRLEEVWIPGDEYPLILPRTSPALYLLQHLRDESHRFAITHHRSKRSKAMTRSILDDVPGLGPAKQTALLKAKGSVANIRKCTVDELCEVPGIGPALAQKILDHLVPQAQ
ncbi:excinuclease ABC subunit UvrC [Actinomyces vulturis]|uniref:excinuclease ABC subunit UvrC n=1 Tax=Actinomyces vulturis TaxID=1857645 RepID=UPI0008306FFE|nr:excinuclease ABC subunit UvrC [Actinomyces vulturis]